MKNAVLVLTCLLTSSLLCACRSQPTHDDGTERTALATLTKAVETPASTFTPAPIATDKPTATATPTSTPRPTIPSASPTSTSTPTPMPTFTPLPTVSQPTPTLIPAAPPSQAHVFNETPIQPFDADVFIRYLGLMRDSFRSAADEFPQIFSGAKSGDCGSYIGWFALWVTEAPGFEDVPPEWYPLYSEYRSLLHQAVSVTWEIHEVCDAGGGTVSKETDVAAQAFIEWAYPRSEEMILEAQRLPRP